MTIERAENGSLMTLTIAGRLDTVSAPELEAELAKIPADTSALTLDIEKLDYVSSAGLRILLLMHKRFAKQGGFTVEHANEVIMEIFDVTGFADILTLK